MRGVVGAMGAEGEQIKFVAADGRTARPRLVARMTHPAEALSLLAPGGASAHGLARPSVLDGPGERSQVPRPDQPDRNLSRDSLYRYWLAGADLTAGLCAVIIVHAVAGGQVLGWDLLAAPMLVVLAKLLGRYERDAWKLRRSTLDQAPALLTLAAFYALFWSLIAPSHPAFHLRVAVLWGITTALLLTFRFLARAAAQAMCRSERVLIVGSSLARETLAHSLSTDPSAMLEVVGFLPLEDERQVNLGPPVENMPDRRRRDRSFGDLETVAAALKIDRVMLLPTTADNELMLEAVTRTLGLGINVSIVPRLFEVVGSSVEFDSVGGITLLGVCRPGLSRSSRLLKRAMDLAGAGAATLMLSPILLVAALAIKLDSPGPVFFRQRRVGRDGCHFEMLKFRSMVDGAERQRTALEAENETSGLFKISHDPRITRVGSILRACSLDELPQLLNVLRGDMSLVGPRPLVIAEDALIEGRHRERLRLAPGMTGPWQVLGPHRPPLSEMVKTDYLYATTWTLWVDIKILLRTAGHIFARRGR